MYIDFIIRIAYTRAKKGPEESCATITHLLSVPLISKKLDLLDAPSIVHFFSAADSLGNLEFHFSLSAFITLRIFNIGCLELNSIH